MTTVTDLSTDQFLKKFESPSLSEMANQIKSVTDNILQTYPPHYDQPPLQPTLSPSHQNLVPPSFQPQQSYIPQPVASYPETQQEEEFDDDQNLADAHLLMKNQAEKQKILKENYLKSEQRNFALSKELLQKDLNTVKFLHKQALQENDIDAQNELVSKQTTLQSELFNLERSHDDFLKDYQKVLDDEPYVPDYAPSYNEEPSYQETESRFQFRKSNPWYDYEVNQTYNPSLVEKATELESNMINEYQLKNMTHYIETPYYFNDLKNRLFQLYGIQNNQPAGDPMSQNHFVPPYIPQIQNQNPQNPQLPYQQPQQPLSNQPYNEYGVTHQPHQPQQFQSQPYNQQQPMQQPQFQAPPQMMGPPTSVPSYGPPVSPVVDQRNDFNAQEMYSNKAFQIFKNSLNSSLVPNLERLSHEQQLRLFNSAIKNKGVIPGGN